MLWLVFLSLHQSGLEVIHKTFKCHLISFITVRHVFLHDFYVAEIIKRIDENGFRKRIKDK